MIPGYDSFACAEGYVFDESAAEGACAFFTECLKHIEGAVAGKPFVLEPWQRAIVGALFGWKRLSDGYRRYREALIYVPRKNGKTPLAAGIANYVLFADDEWGQQNFAAAAERDQASLVYRHVVGMIRQEHELERRCRIFDGLTQRAIQAEKGVFRVLSADAHTKHGGNPHLVIIDELHAQRDRELVDVLTTSMASANRKQPLLVYITTADYEREGSICNEKHRYACQVRDGVIRDPSFLPIIYEASLADDWRSPEVWAKVNPNLGVSVSREYLERECQKAQEIPAYESTFRRLHLNTRVEVAVRWLPMERWDACGAPLNESELHGQPCFGGLDMSSTRDVTAWVMYFPAQKATLCRFFVPEECARDREKRDKVPYSAWAGQGFITFTPGNVVDYGFVREKILADSQVFNIRDIGVDRWNAQAIMTDLSGAGLVPVAFGQGFASMSGPSKEFEKLVFSGQLRHGGNPVLRWMAANASVETDAAANLKPSKKKSSEKIDGIVALVMAIGRSMVFDLNAGVSVYESRGVTYL